MKTIEEIKIELTLKMLSDELSWSDIGLLPVNDELRTFVCSLGPKWARLYAAYVDRKTHPETREAAYKDPYQKHWYMERFEDSLRKGLPFIP